MVIDLKVNEVKTVFGGSHWMCDIGDVIKKGAHAGALAYCLSMRRKGLIGQRYILNEDSRRAVTKGICSSVITGCIEATSHLIKWGTGIDCSECLAITTAANTTTAFR